MAMSKIMRATLRAISKHDINVKENYENTRKFFDAAHPVSYTHLTSTC